MERKMLQQHLQEAEKPIALGAQHLYDQRALVARLEWDGRHDEVTAAKALVAQLEDALRAGPMGQGPPPNSDSELCPGSAHATTGATREGHSPRPFTLRKAPEEAR